MTDDEYFFLIQGNYSYTLQIFQAEHLFLVKAIFGKHYGHDALKSTSLQYVVCIWLP